MNQSVKIYAIPAAIVILFFINAFTPVEVLGCFTRGLVAFTIAMISGIAAFVTAIIAIKKGYAKDPAGTQWILLTLILAIPSIALLYLA